MRSYYFNYFSKTYHSTELKEFIDISRKAQSFHPNDVCLLFDNYVVYAVCCSTICFGKWTENAGKLMIKLILTCINRWTGRCMTKNTFRERLNLFYRCVTTLNVTMLLHSYIKCWYIGVKISSWCCLREFFLTIITSG